MFKLVGISLILAVIQISESGPVYQFLPPRDGYVPVYIRLGNTPLDEINPDLALAFHESNIESKNILDEEMQNDAPISDELSESVDESVQKDSDSEEDENTEVKSTDEAYGEELFPQKKRSDSPKKVEEETESEEEPALTQLTKDNDSEEVVPSTTNTAKSEPPHKETKNGKRITAPPSDDDSSEEIVDKTEKKAANTSLENKSSEEVEI